jgi:hypothetical protein
MNPQPKKNTTPQPEYEFDPFEDPRTIPTGWDLSEMFKNKEDQKRPAWNDPDRQERNGFDF